MRESAMDLLDELGAFRGIDNTELNPARLTTLQALVVDTFNTKQMPLLKCRFRSRKNIVVHLQIPMSINEPVDFVAKLFVIGSYERELQVLRKSLDNGLGVPTVLAAQDGVILYSYIPGETLVDFINRTFDPVMIDNLASWYHDFHTVHGEIKGDPRLRNFIWNGNRLFGVDFEESHPNHWITDIAGAAASLLDTDPIFDGRKRELAWRLFRTYLSLRCSECDPAINHLFITTVADTLEQTAYHRKDNRVLKLAQEVRTDGF
jgi:hypothetical protein